MIPRSERFRPGHLTRSRRLRLEQLESRHLLSTLPAGFQEDLVAGGLYEPTSITVAPDGRIFVTEKPYGVRVIENGQLLPTPFVSLDVERAGERGVEGLVFDPNFAQNRYLYVYYTHETATGSFDRLSRFTASASNPNVAEANSEFVLIDGIPTSEPGFHNGGVLQFGADGMLYLGVGDTGNTALAQDLSKLQGKILRLNVGNGANIIPSDNPFVNTSGARGEIWAYGFRNPFTGDMVPGTNRLIIGDVGSDDWEEINEVAKGKNYGWPLAEGVVSDPQFTNPLYAYPHAGDGAAIVGGEVYSGTNFPAAYQGKYFFADYVRSFIKTLDLTTKTVETFSPDAFIPVDLATAPDGTLYWASLGYGSDTNGAVYRIRYVGGNRAPIAVAGANVTNGIGPLAVQFSAAGSSDPDNDTIVSYQWDFGDGTTGSGLTPTHVYTSTGQYSAVLTVSDGHLSGSSQPLVITVGNTAPTPVINLPVINSTYRAGDTISFSGSATDPQQGTLPASSLDWAVEFHHNTHFHPGIVAQGTASGSFVVALTGEVDPDQWYRIKLTATDAGGLKSTTFRDVYPVTSTFKLESSIAGASLLLDGQPTAAGTTITGVVNMSRTLSAPPTQLIGGKMYKFTGWSDGGAVEHTISTPATATTYRANYQLMPLAATYAATAPAAVLKGQTVTFALTVTNVGTETWSYLGTNRVRLGVYFDGTSDAVGAWAKDPLRFTLPKNVAPGQSVTINVSIPTPATTGNVVLRARLVKEGTTPTWFEPLLKTNVAVQSLGASYAGNPPTDWNTNQKQEFQVTLTNTGTATWSNTGNDRVRLAAYFGAADTPAAGATVTRIELPRAVAPGESVTVTVTLAGPTTAGSTTLRTRLEKLGVGAGWFDTMLRTAITAQTFSPFFSGSPPTTWQAGERKTYTITVYNLGSTTWNATGTNPVRLGVYFGIASDTAPLTSEPVRFVLPKNVAPGQSVTMTVTMEAPNVAGSLVLRHRMVRENVGWSDQMLKTTVNIQKTLAATYTGTIPTTWGAGETKTITLTVKNTGTQAWNVTGANQVRLGFYWGGDNDDVGAGLGEPERVYLSSGKLTTGAAVTTSVAPGQSVVLTFTVKAPLTPGLYMLRSRMVKENVAWFDDLLRTGVTVS
ncbi:PQQ-dependent sugar dehydrogenase [Anatilimnocola floriformis]|uniref:PQQ-dependent sugar dehydrogenase n=1 Tax=Anatilimnocola floriformis TaxID=2948575 RepID=UPI0020C331B9|nr:PQQ-dependent sugar dehydrogenase [Anatilimnocola floriformis]